ncbi:hypothetical protein [Mesorhizobium sp. YM1C-6-2]|uniref:hypothetical protein n=1 Tax=Mesorhizobium sp. YM1C-6-2 TaxID=1827501 RepID=UPI000EF1C60D|nr:hypothetical protein [Mesorhizobium sp. YM1C-6-2]RLP28489.1 hypothetical protein D8676_00910 [Mesorhizobium sp. YM1C-6-2]
MITILATGVTLAFAMATGAQAQSEQAPAQAPTQAPAQAEPPAAAPEAPNITSVSVIDIEELPEDTQKQVNDVVSQRGEADLERLRTSIDGMPQLKSALEAKGMTSAQVIAASMGADGALTLITKKAS